ncbi:hypothetical protein T01_14540, partial [Trichinella spiralis]
MAALLTNTVNPEDHLLERQQSTLAWIKGAPARWKPFVANREQEIQESVFPECWRYCPTKENPADISSRVKELSDAEARWLREVQVKEFGIKPDSAERLREVEPFLDQEGLLRVGGRRRRSTLPPESKPILPHNHPVTELLIKDHHVRQMHAGIYQTLVAIRTRFWIITARNATKKVIRSCLVCRRVDAQPYGLRMGDLPADRVTESPLFIHTGVDFAGPLFICPDVQGRDARENKAYVCIFTCLPTRAVYVELLRGQTTDSFLQGLRRFISGRGRPRVIQSDNFRSYKLADTFIQCLFRDSNWEKLQRKFNEERIQWKFITPRTPWCGGYWERLIRSIKNALRKTIREARETLELTLRKGSSQLLGMTTAASQRHRHILSTVKRWDGRQRKVINVEIPNILKNYNMNMGGIDLKNMLAALYRIEHKSRKWTRRIFFWIISTAMTDAWQ